MPRDTSLLQLLRDTMRQAAYSLETLKLTRADEDAKISRLMRELRAFDRNADSEEDSDREALTAD